MSKEDAAPAPQNAFGMPSPMGRDWEVGVVPDSGTVVAAFSARAAAENLIQQLQQSGYDVRKLSIVENHRTEGRVVGFHTSGDRIRRWGKLGVIWGFTVGLLYGAAHFVIPETGPGPLAGLLRYCIAGAFGGAVTIGGLSAVTASVYSMSLPKDSVLRYALEMETDNGCILVASSADEATTARDLFRSAQAAGLGEHSSSPWHPAGAAL